jgi:DNA-binding SARP family transcriptional activator
MSNDQSNIFLRRMLSELLPDAFFHPVWTHWVGNSANDSSDSIRHLLQNLLLERIEDDLASNCQCVFLCAYLQSRLGEHAAALASIEQVWKLAETHNMHQVSRCAAWGACAICVRWGNYPQALDWMNKLQEKLKETHEWILVDILELFRQILEAPVPSSRGELLGWLLRWGELPPAETPNRLKGGEKAQRIGIPVTGIISRVNGLWSSFRNFVRFGARGGSRLQWSPPRDELTPGDQVQATGSSPNPRVSLSDSNRLAAKEVFFSENNQMTSEASDLSAPLLQSHLTSAPTPLHSSPQEVGLPSFAVYCLGQFQVYQDEQSVENWSSRKGLSVFKYLILEHPAPVGKEILMDTFWPDSDPESARRNLHQAIYSLRQTFRGEQQEFHHIWFKNDCYSLNPNLETWIDFREFQMCIEAGRRLEIAGQIEEAIEQYGTAEGLYHGEFLEEDPYEEWPVVQRQQLLNQYLSLVDKLSEFHFQNRQYAAAVYFCQKILAKDRCYEAAHRLLMQCYLAQGLRHLAIRQYQTCIRALREEVAIEPSEETVTLYKRIVSHSES